MTECSCAGSGYTTDGYLVGSGPCTCDARPFERTTVRVRTVEPDRPLPALTRVEHARFQVIETSVYADTITTIDDLLEWSRHALGPVVALGQWCTYLERGPLDIAARHILLALDHLDAALLELPPVVEKLRTAALDQIGEAAA